MWYNNGLIITYCRSEQIPPTLVETNPAYQLAGLHPRYRSTTTSWDGKHTYHADEITA